MNEYLEQLSKLIDLSQNRPLNEIVYEGLRKAIIGGIIPAGERINEKVYSDYMNISRTPIRNAIDKLKHEGIIEHIPNYGVVVKRVSVADAEEIYKIRTALDILASTTAMHQMTEENFREMEELLNKTKLANDNGEVKEVIQYFSSFNSMIYRFARMPKLEIITDRLQQYLSRFRKISLYDDERRSKAIEEHFKIYKYLKTKDENLLAAVIRDHLNASKEFIIKEIIRYEAERKDLISDIYEKTH
ncbi:GntR family transcriptional regulator [Lutispora thermophila]|uniref:DNA-binding transcriptional regulator, GntR family n=1 Tax=Lutispora thermophila DSM 19022 TaxID=1122184 RepID=A0A1M6IDS4_9FIRM|nr:GntR family transcriptional regulator [Lutispora thermophila]SHJ32594.1 DNA-binding transcriptional regulator, GntR family [Lutispora thermophila DSM 19022]